MILHTKTLCRNKPNKAFVCFFFSFALFSLCHEAASITCVSIPTDTARSSYDAHITHVNIYLLCPVLEQDKYIGLAIQD